MSNNMEDWKCQQDAKRAAAHKDGPFAFVAGGGATANRREYEEHRVSDELSRAAQIRRKMLIETTMKDLQNAVRPDEIAGFRDVLLKLNLTDSEKEQLQTLLVAKNG